MFIETSLNIRHCQRFQAVATKKQSVPKPLIFSDPKSAKPALITKIMLSIYVSLTPILVLLPICTYNCEVWGASFFSSKSSPSDFLIDKLQG